MNRKMRNIVWMGSLLLGAAQAMPLDYQLGHDAPKPELRVISAHAFIPPPLSAAVQVEQDVLDLPAGVCTGFHSHGGPGIETVLSGEIMVESRGVAPDQTFKTGQAYIYPAGVVHNVCNMTALPATFTSALLLLDGAPPVTPVADISGGATRTTPDMPTPEDLKAFSFTEGSENDYQVMHGRMLQMLTDHGFERSWTQEVQEGGEVISYAVWYQPQFDVTVLCAAQKVEDSHTQSVYMMPGKLRRSDVLLRF